MVNPALFSSQRDDWATPRWLFDRLDSEFGFTLDPCATRENATCPRFYTPAEDGLRQSWRGSVFVNPPYGGQIERWIQKAHESACENGATVCLLLPSRTDTRWFHRFALPFASELRFFRGRLRFEGAKHSAPFPSVLVVFRPSLPQPGPQVAPLLVTSFLATPTGPASHSAPTGPRTARACAPPWSPASALSPAGPGAPHALPPQTRTA